MLKIHWTVTSCHAWQEQAFVPFPPPCLKCTVLFPTIRRIPITCRRKRAHAEWIRGVKRMTVHRLSLTNVVLPHSTDGIRYEISFWRVFIFSGTLHLLHGYIWYSFPARTVRNHLCHCHVRQWRKLYPFVAAMLLSLLSLFCFAFQQVLVTVFLTISTKHWRWWPGFSQNNCSSGSKRGGE